MNNATTMILQERFKSPDIVIPYNLVDVEYCVFKLFYNEKYVILMGKTLFRQVEIIRYNLSYYFSRGENKKERSNQSEDFCAEFYKYIRDNPKGKFHFELILSDRNAYKLLQANQIELDKAATDDNCLNTNMQPVFSKHIQAPHHKHWINRGYYLNFRKWQWNRPTKPKGSHL